MALNPYDTRPGRLHRVAETSRRQFLLLMGTVGALGATMFGSLQLLKFMFPAATNEDPPQFKTTFGVADLPAVGVKSITEKRVAVVRDNGGVYAVYLVCTHLGCTPNYVTDVAGDLTSSLEEKAKGRGDRGSPNDSHRQPDGWACPCHGSRYFIDSTNFYGPAPRPMDWVSVITTPDGKLFIDRASLVAYRQPGDQVAPTWRLQPDGSVKGSKLGV
ncbi:MAG: ubiquinol-cytochrome c reductase iron-sulfur subunit [Candidatus Dormibacteria bacterium]